MNVESEGSLLSVEETDIESISSSSSPKSKLPRHTQNSNLHQKKSNILFD
jgi:hypothetical protein